MGIPDVETTTDRSSPVAAPELMWISDSGVEPRDVGELSELLDRDDGFVWLDLPSCD